MTRSDSLFEVTLWGCITWHVYIVDLPATNVFLQKFLWNQSLGAEPAKAPALILTPLMTKYGANYDWLLLMTTQVTSGAPIDPEARHPSMRIMAVTEEIRTPFARAILWSISYLLPYDFWPVLYRTCIAWSIEWYKRVIFNLRYARPFIIFIRSKK